MAQNTGTLVSAAIRPNDDGDLIASAFQNEIKGGLHSYPKKVDMENIITDRREWGMQVSVYDGDALDDNGLYELKYSLDADINDNSNWVKISSLPNLLFEKTHAEILALISASMLVTGAYYIISDFQTIHRITLTNSINTGNTEPLVVKAISTNQFDINASSTIFKNDIILYDISDTVCEDGITSRKGKINFRMDTRLKVSAHYDWRNVKFRRWALNTASYATWSSATTYTANALVLDASNNLWVSNSDGNINNTPSTTANSYWTLVWDNVIGTKKYFITSGVNVSFGLFTLIPNSADFKDYYTFHNITTDTQYSPNLLNLNNIEIGASLEPTASNISNNFGYNNIVFLLTTNTYTQYNIFKTGNVNTTIFSDNANNFFYGNSFEAYTNLLYFRGGGYYLIFKPTTIQNIFGLNFNSSGGIFIRSVFSDNLIGIQAYNSNVQDIRVLNGATNNSFRSAVVRAVIGINNARNSIDRVTDLRILGNGIMTSTRIGPFEVGNSATSGNYRLLTSNINGGADTFTVRIPLTFNGTTGFGTVGTLTLDRITIPSGWAVDTVIFRGTNIIYGVGAAINIGFTGNLTACLDSTSGLISNANDFFKVRPTTAASTSNTALITGSVTGANITSGTAILNITFIKI